MTEPPSAVPTSRWRATTFALLLAAVWLLVWYRETGLAMVSIWGRSETFAHGYVVPLISGWLVWRDRERIRSLVPAPTLWPLPLIFAAGVVWLMGGMANANSPSQLALVAMLVLLVPALAGGAVARALAFPLAFLFFAVPVGEFLLPQLMSSTADFTVAALRFTGVPVYREGQHLVIPTGQWSVVEACSGIRYLIASLMVGTLYAYLSYRSLYRRLGFVAISALVPLVANWVRAYLIVLLGHLSNNRLATGVDHIVYGWVFFGIVMALMFWVGSFWHETAPAAPERRHIAPEIRPSQGVGRQLVAMALVATATAAPRLWSVEIQHHQAAVSTAKLSSLVVPGWSASEGGVSGWKPHFQWASDELHRTYRRGPEEVGLFVGYYRNQDFERKLISSENVLVTTQDSAWIRSAGGERTIRYLGDSLRVTWAELFNMPADERLMAWKWYWVAGHVTANDFVGKAYTSLSRLLDQGDDSAVIVVYARRGRAGEGEAAMAAFLAEAGPAIERMLQETRRRK